MFICVCNAVSDREIRDLARRGVDSIEELRMLTGCGDCCGRCADEAETLLADLVEARETVSLPIAQVARPA